MWSGQHFGIFWGTLCTVQYPPYKQSTPNSQRSTGAELNCVVSTVERQLYGPQLFSLARPYNARPLLSLSLSSLFLPARTHDTQHLNNIGRQVKNWNEAQWVEKREEIVYEGNFAKFSQNPKLKKRLLSYGNKRIFVESSPYDKIWGIGLQVKDEKGLGIASDDKNWKGLNLLGIAITQVRDELAKT